MRTAAIKAITRLAKKDKDIIFIAGDLGFGVLDEFRQTCPKQFFNAGICEQSMASISAGLALEGKKVYLYSIANFPTLRCIEQIRNDVCYHNLSVTILVVGGGFAYGSLGMSHHATEDIAMMRSLPNMKVFVPADAIESQLIVEKAYLQKGPCYIRLNKGGEKSVHNVEVDNYEIGKELCVRDGKDIVIFAVGAIVQEAINAADILQKQGISVAVYSFCSIKPIDSTLILDCAKRFGKIITVEEHNIIGGLGSAVSEVVATSGMATQVVRLGLQDTFTNVIGSQEYLQHYYGIDKKKIADVIGSVWSENDV